MGKHYDAIVIGLGVVGSTAAWLLARAGLSVLVLEQFELDHQNGSSYGSSRIIRYAYDHPAYIPLAHTSYPLWRELEEDSGEQLLHITGGLDFGPAEEASLLTTRETLRNADMPCDWLTPDEVSARFPQFRLDDHMMGLYQPDGGALSASRCVIAAARMALKHGATLQTGARVTAIEAHSDSVTVRTDDEAFSAARLVVSAGSWSGPLLRGIGLDLPLQPTREQLFFFDTQDRAAFLPGRMPYFREHGARHSTYDSPLHFYGIPNIDGCGFKASIHTNGENTDPDNTLRTVDDSVCELLRAFFRRHIPLADSPLKTGRVCLYTMTPDEHFILDQHPQHAHIAIGAGFSGHGFKFGVASGKILADLVTVGESSLDISLFALSRFGAGVN